MPRVASLARNCIAHLSACSFALVLSFALAFSFAGRALSQQVEADSLTRFCDSTDVRNSSDCRPDPALEQKVVAATELFKEKNYSQASQAYLDAFRNTPLRPVDGPAHGLMIASLNETKQFNLAIEEVLRRDRLLARDDYKLWSDLAFVARGLAVSTSVDAAQQTLTDEFQKYPSKLKSRVWALLPKGTISTLMDHKFRSEAVYTGDTQNPNIRRDIEKFIAGNPHEPFVEFAYFTVGQYDQALAVNAKSVIADVLEYARAYQEIAVLQTEIQDYLKSHPDPGDRPLSAVLPDFAARAAVAKPHLQAVLRYPLTLPHADDAAYWLGWFASEEGNNDEALRYLSQAMIVGNGDYRPAAIRLSLNIIEGLDPRQMVATIVNSEGLTASPAAWYVASRSAYRQFDYKSAIDIVKQALNQFKIPNDRLPATTDAPQIAKALDAILYPPNPAKPKPQTDSNSDDADWHPIDPNLLELPYILQAAGELSDYET
jgi:tetratricopeptide (TPR) repeat protein